MVNLLELENLFKNQGFSDRGINTLYLLAHELDEVASEEIKKNSLDNWFNLNEDDFVSTCHEYNYDTEHDGIQLSFECSIILDEHEENGFPYLNTLYHSVLLKYPDGTEKNLDWCED